MEKFRLWQFAQICAVVAVVWCLSACSNDDTGDVSPSSTMESTFTLQTAYGTDAVKSPFVCKGDFLLLQWGLSSKYTYFSSVEGKMITLTANPTACVHIKIDDGSGSVVDLADLTKIETVSSNQSEEDGFIWFEKVLSVGPKTVSLKWGSDVDMPSMAEQPNVVFPHLEFTDPHYSCTASATDQFDGGGKRIHKVDFVVTQDLYSVNAPEKVSEQEVYSFSWFVAL